MIPNSNHIQINDIRPNSNNSNSFYQNSQSLPPENEQQEDISSNPENSQQEPVDSVKLYTQNLLFSTNDIHIPENSLSYFNSKMQTPCFSENETKKIENHIKNDQNLTQKNQHPQKPQSKTSTPSKFRSNSADMLISQIVSNNPLSDEFSDQIMDSAKNLDDISDSHPFDKYSMFIDLLFGQSSTDNQKGLTNDLQTKLADIIKEQKNNESLSGFNDRSEQYSITPMIQKYRKEIHQRNAHIQPFYITENNPKVFLNSSNNGVQFKFDGNDELNEDSENEIENKTSEIASFESNTTTNNQMNNQLTNSIQSKSKSENKSIDQKSTKSQSKNEINLIQNNQFDKQSSINNLTDSQLNDKNNLLHQIDITQKDKNDSMTFSINDSNPLLLTNKNDSITQKDKNASVNQILNPLLLTNKNDSITQKDQNASVNQNLVNSNSPTLIGLHCKDDLTTNLSANDLISIQTELNNSSQKRQINKVVFNVFDKSKQTHDTSTNDINTIQSTPIELNSKPMTVKTPSKSKIIPKSKNRLVSVCKIAKPRVNSSLQNSQSSIEMKPYNGKSGIRPTVNLTTVRFPNLRRESQPKPIINNKLILEPIENNIECFTHKVESICSLLLKNCTKGEFSRLKRSAELITKRSTLQLKNASSSDFLNESMKYVKQSLNDRIDSIIEQYQKKKINNDAIEDLIKLFSDFPQYSNILNEIINKQLETKSVNQIANEDESDMIDNFDELDFAQIMNFLPSIISEKEIDEIMQNHED